MGSVGVLVEFVQHVEEVLDIADILSRYVVLSAYSMSIGIGSQCGDITQNTINLLIPDLFVFVYGLAD